MIGPPPWRGRGAGTAGAGRLFFFAVQLKLRLPFAGTYMIFSRKRIFVLLEAVRFF